MSLKKYEVTTDGRHPHTTTLLLSDEDAKRMGVFGADAKQTTKKAAPKAPANKARAPRNKAAAPVAETPPAATSVEDASDPDASE